MEKIINNKLLFERSCAVLDTLKGFNPVEAKMILENCLIPINIRVKELQDITSKLTKIITKQNLDHNKDL